VNTSSWSGRNEPPLAVGLDIGGTNVIGVLLGPDDGVRGTVRLPTMRGVEGVVATAIKAVHALLDGEGIRSDAQTPIGIGVPGIVDPVTGTVAHAVNLGFAGEPTPLAQLLSVGLSGARVRAENDLNVAVLGAACTVGPAATGEVESAPDLAFLALGTGLAAGLLLDGRLRRGAFGAAGEIGHLPYVVDGPVCACGQRGCLELYASGASLDARWPGPGDVPAPVALFAAAAAGDRAAVRVRDDFARAVATAVRILVLTTDVGRIVLGGGVSELGAPLLDAVVGALDAQTRGSDFLTSMRIGARVHLAPPGVPVAAIGAAILARGTVGEWK